MKPIILGRIAIKYYLIESGHDEFQIVCNNVKAWQVQFPFAWNTRYGFKATSSSGDVFELRSRGLFFWRKLALYKNAVKVAYFSSNRCLSEGSPYWLDSRRVLYRADQKLFSIGDGSSYGVENAIFCWEFPEDENDCIVNTLILLSIQGHGHVTGVRFN
jgi:hypothetical protein